MLTEIYIEAILTDSELADEVWELWNAEVITDEVASLAWKMVANRRFPANFVPPDMA